jgi:hypothetical protein
LRWSDVDWKRLTLKIARSLTVLHREPSEGPTKTHQRRDIAIDDASGAFLVHRRARQEEYAALVGTKLVVAPFILSRVADGSVPCLPGRSHSRAQADGDKIGFGLTFPRVAALCCDYCYRCRVGCPHGSRATRTCGPFGHPARIRARDRSARPGPGWTAGEHRLGHQRRPDAQSRRGAAIAEPTSSSN